MFTDKTQKRLFDLLFLVAYLLSGALGISIPFHGTNAVSVWVPAGIAVAYMLLMGYRVWPLIFLGGMLLNMHFLFNKGADTIWLGVSGIIAATGNLIEVLSIVFLIDLLRNKDREIKSAQDVLAFSFSAIPASLLSAVFGTLSLWVFTRSSESLWPMLTTWWLGDFLGIIIVGPAVLYFRELDFRSWKTIKTVEFLGLIVVLIAFTLLVAKTDLPVKFLLFSIMLWPAFRFGRPVTALLILFSITLAIIFEAGATEQILLSHTQELLIFQLYFGVISFVFLLTSAALEERKKASIELKLSEEKFKKAFKTNPDSINLNRFSDGLYIEINDGFEQIMGYSAADIRGKSSLELNIWADPADRQRLIDGLIKDGIVRNLEAKFKARNGDIKVGLMSAALINMEGETVILSITRDITDRKKIEDDLVIAKEKAEESDRLKSMFLSNVSHEIRTPLNGILGFLDLLKEPDLTDVEKNTFINTIEKSGQHLLSTINDIIEVSTIEAGQIVIRPSEFDLNDTISSLYNFFSPQAAGKGIELNLDIPGGSKARMISTDKTKLVSILTNLVRNAIKFTSEGFVEFGYKAENENINFFVKDTGCGIPADRLNLVFDRFVQADMKLSRPYEGSGLGLSIAKAFTEKLGGSIGVESVEGAGSHFFFTIPCCLEKEQTETVNPKTIKNSKAKGKILIAEDDLASRELYERILTKKGYEVLHVSNGAEAVETVKKNSSIDLVLMDIKMPLMDGIDATREIRSFNRVIPIIAQTAYSLSEEKQVMLKAGCNDYISKPIDRDLLFSKMAGLLG